MDVLERVVSALESDIENMMTREPDKVLYQTVFGWSSDAEDRILLIPIPLVENVEPDLIFKGAVVTLQYYECEAFGFISEAWVSFASLDEVDLDNLDDLPPPSEDPRSKESMIVVFDTDDGGIASMNPISRKDTGRRHLTSWKRSRYGSDERASFGRMADAIRIVRERRHTVPEQAVMLTAALATDLYKLEVLERKL